MKKQFTTNYKAAKGGVSTAGNQIQLSELLKEDTIDKMIKHVKDGYGWIDVDYVLDNPHFKFEDGEKAVALIRLAKAGMLVDADKLNGTSVDLEKSDIPKRAFMKPVDVVRKYKHLVKSRYGKNEAVNESKVIDVVDKFNNLDLPNTVYLNKNPYTGKAFVMNGYNGYTSSKDDGWIIDSATRKPLTDERGNVLKATPYRGVTWKFSNGVKQKGFAKRESVKESFPDLKKWWTYEPDEIMRFVYWGKRQIPPSDPKKWARAWKDIEKQLQQRFPKR